MKIETKRWTLQAGCQLVEWWIGNWKRYKWQNFDLIRFSIEHAGYGDYWQLDAALLGFWIHTTYWYRA